MDNATIQKLKEAIASSKSIGIAVGKGYSIDDMAAALALYLILRDSNKSVSVACPEDPIVEVSSLVGIDKVQRSLGGTESGDLIVSFPYREEGEIEKVSYTVENNFLNIIVKAGEKGLSFDERDVKYIKGGGGTVDLLFVIGTPRLSDLGDVIDPQNLRDTKVINIDNKEENQRFGDIVMVSPNFSSVSEQIGDFVLSLEMNIDRDPAQNLMSGVTIATGNFQDPMTTPLAFEIASDMLRRGAARLRIITREEQEQQQKQQQQQPVRNNALPRQQSETPRPQQPQQQQQQQPQQPQQQRPRDNQQADNRFQGQRGQDRNKNDRDNRDNRGDNRSREDKIREELNKGQNDSQNGNAKTPDDWMTPKVYKGSSNVE